MEVLSFHGLHEVSQVVDIEACNAWVWKPMGSRVEACNYVNVISKPLAILCPVCTLQGGNSHFGVYDLNFT